MLHILGIRHHGAGSARNVVEQLDAIQPDIVLVEGPPEFDSLLQWVGQDDLRPPVALLGYNQAMPQQATFYPFALFSPEWQAITWANQHKRPVRMLDLPLQHTFAQKEAAASALSVETTAAHTDPMLHLAALEGYADSEAWWEARFEREGVEGHSAAHFEAVLTAMQALREAGIRSSMDSENVLREAWMRQIIREAQRDLYTEIAVVCGAWHGPALLDVQASTKEDAAIIKQLPKSKIKIAATWIPWSNERLAMRSGYGAGITSPGWSMHCWQHPNQRSEYWLSHVANLFRKKQFDISTAHVLEAVRLADQLAMLRGFRTPALAEMDEAITAVMCMGDAVRLQYIRDELTVGHTTGSVPDNLAKLPLQADFEEQARSLRLTLQPKEKTYTLDLRNAKNQIDLSRSVFLHRLHALQVGWGEPEYDEGAKGTFKEIWNLDWQPENLIRLIEKGAWGNTVEEAASAWLIESASKTTAVSGISELIQRAVPAELYTALGHLLLQFRDMAAISADVTELLAAFVPLVRVRRYGSVRKTDLASLDQIADGLLKRACIGLSGAVIGLDEAAAQHLFTLLKTTNEGVRLLENPELSQLWKETLLQLPDIQTVHPLLNGCITRLLFDSQGIDEQQTARYLSVALSAGNESDYSAYWIEGFLKSSGMVLLYDHLLWNILYDWTEQLPEPTFIELLPILRRTFAKYNPAERRQLGEKAQRGIVLDTKLIPQEADPVLAESTSEDIEAVLQTFGSILFQQPLLN